MAATEASLDQTLDKVAVSGPILARIMQEFGSSRGDCDGLLFGHMDRTISTKLGDDDEQSSKEELTAIITGFYCSGALFGFYDGAGCIDLAKLGKITGDRESRGVDTLIGWFVGRRNSPVRPSLREVAITRHLSLRSTRNNEGNGLLPAGDSSRSSPLHMVSPSGGVSSPIDVDIPLCGSPGKVKQSMFRDGTTNTPSSRMGDGSDQDMSTKPSPKSGSASLRASPLKDIALDAKLLGATSCSPCLFILFTESGTQQAVHTHDYRAYQYHATLGNFEPKAVRIVNIGPAFRGDYDSFSPVVPFPLLSGAMEGEGESQSRSSSMGARSSQRDSLGGSSRRTHTPPCKEQALLDVYAEGYKVERLSSLVGPYGMRQVPELEELYAKMLLKLENLAKQVCESSSVLIEQEKINARLKRGYKGPPE